MRGERVLLCPSVEEKGFLADGEGCVAQTHSCFRVLLLGRQREERVEECVVLSPFLFCCFPLGEPLLRP